MDYVLRYNDICYYYENGGKKSFILDHADYAFEKSKLYTILGPSGSGKTTALSLAAALDSPKGGQVLFEGRDIKDIGFTNYRNRNIGIVFQSYNLLTYMNALQNVTMAMEITGSKVPNKKERAFELLEHVGLSHEMALRNVNKLSGGEQQRVAIARAISTDADLILADEPTGNLDADTAQEIIKIFIGLAHDSGKCVIAVTHSEEFARQADVVVRLSEGRLK